MGLICQKKHTQRQWWSRLTLAGTVLVWFFWGSFVLYFILWLAKWRDNCSFTGGPPLSDAPCQILYASSWSFIFAVMFCCACAPWVPSDESMMELRSRL